MRINPSQEQKGEVCGHSGAELHRKRALQGQLSDKDSRIWGAAEEVGETEE